MKKKIKNKGFFEQKKIQLPETEDIPIDQQPPKFSLRYLNGDYCISRCQDNEKVSFVDKMHRLSQLSWAQIRNAPRHGLGYEKINSLSIASGFPPHLTEDVNIIAFRFHGEAPMVGYRDTDGTFYIIWFDRNFTLYKH